MLYLLTSMKHPIWNSTVGKVSSVTEVTDTALWKICSESPPRGTSLLASLLLLVLAAGPHPSTAGNTLPSWWQLSFGVLRSSCLLALG